MTNIDLACRNCRSDWGVQDSEDDSCLNCGGGTVDPADRPMATTEPLDVDAIRANASLVWRASRTTDQLVRALTDIDRLSFEVERLTRRLDEARTAAAEWRLIAEGRAS